MSGLFKAVGGLFGGGSEPKLPDPLPPPTQESAEDKSQDLKRGKLARLIGGRNRASSILTSPQGVIESTGNIGIKKLLGQ